MVTAVNDNASNGIITASASISSDLADSNLDNNNHSITTVVQALEGTLTLIKKTTPAAAGDETFTYQSSAPVFDGMELKTSGNAASSTPVTVSSGDIWLVEEERDGWVLDSMVCEGDTDAGTTVDTDQRRADIDLDPGEAIICTFTSRRDAEDVIRRTSAVIYKFMSHRADIVTANAPNLTSRLTRRNQPGGALDGSFALKSEGQSRQFSLSARTSLSAINNAGNRAGNGPDNGLDNGPGSSKQYTRHGLKDLLFENHAPGLLPARDFDAWIDTTLGHLENETSSGSFGLVHMGVDQLIRDDLLIGLLAQVDWVQLEDKTETYEAEGLGWMVGPYMVARLGEKLHIDGRVAWGRSRNSVNPLGLYEDDFDTERWMARGQLTGHFTAGRLKIEPMVRGTYFQEVQSTYVDSLDNTIPKQIISLSRLTFGPTFSVHHETDAGYIMVPSFGIRGIWDFDPAKQVDTDTGIVSSPTQHLHARMEFGLTLYNRQQLSVSGSAFFDGIGANDNQSYGFMGKIIMQLN